MQGNNDKGLGFKSISEGKLDLFNLPIYVVLRILYFLSFLSTNISRYEVTKSIVESLNFHS
jgi:hypothetical protein